MIPGKSILPVVVSTSGQPFVSRGGEVFGILFRQKISPIGEGADAGKRDFLPRGSSGMSLVDLPEQRARETARADSNASGTQRETNRSADDGASRGTRTNRSSSGSGMVVGEGSSPAEEPEPIDQEAARNSQSDGCGRDTVAESPATPEAPVPQLQPANAALLGAGRSSAGSPSGGAAETEFAASDETESSGDAAKSAMSCSASANVPIGRDSSRTVERRVTDRTFSPGHASVHRSTELQGAGAGPAAIGAEPTGMTSGGSGSCPGISSNAGGGGLRTASGPKVRSKGMNAGAPATQAWSGPKASSVEGRRMSGEVRPEADSREKGSQGSGNAKPSGTGRQGALHSVTSGGGRPPGNAGDGRGFAPETHSAMAVSTAAGITVPNSAGQGSPVAVLAHAGNSFPRDVAAAPENSSAITATFQRMDQAPAPRVVEAGPQGLTVGVRDAGLGWLEIHAHGSAGQVTAIVATESKESYTAITQALPSMRESLAAAQVRVGHLGSEQWGGPPGGSGNSGGERGQPQRGTASVAAVETPVGKPGSGSFGDAEEEEGLSYISVRV